MGRILRISVAAERGRRVRHGHESDVAAASFPRS